MYIIHTSYHTLILNFYYLNNKNKKIYDFTFMNYVHWSCASFKQMNPTPNKILNK